MDLYQVAAISLAGLSLLVSIWNYRKNLALNRQIKSLNERKTVAEYFSFYAHLIHSEFLALREELSNMSSLCAEVNGNIGNILDMYDTRSVRYGYVRGEFVRPLRHLYGDLYDGICEAFRHELPWQTVEHLNLRLSDIRFLEPASELQDAARHRRWTLFMAPRRKAAYPELRFLESEPGRGTFVELVHSLDETKTDELISSIRSSFEPIHAFFGKHTQKLADALHALESGWVKNKLEEFRLSENPALYHRYQLLMNTLRFLLHCRALRQGVDTVEKHRLVSSIVVLGSTLAMANWLVCKTIFTIDE